MWFVTRRLFFGQPGRVRHRERRNAPDDLALHAQSLPAGRAQAQAGATAKERVCQRGARRDQMLAVVQDEEELFRGQTIAQRVDERSVRLLANPQNRRHGACHERTI